MNLHLSYMERVELNSQAHSVFSNNWSNYTSKEFGNSLLSKANVLTSKTLKIFDTAELTNSIENYGLGQAGFQLLGFENLEFSVFSFSKESEASGIHNRVTQKNNELAIFIEVQSDREAKVWFKFGKEAAKQFDNLPDNKQKAIDIEQQKFNASLDTIRQSLRSKTSDQNVLEFSLSTIGYELTSMSVASFKKLMGIEYTDFPEGDGVLFDASFTNDGDNDTWSHGDIEKRAFKDNNIFQNNNETLKIYYGNWLRDISSVISGNSVGFNNDDIKVLRRNFENYKVFKVNKNFFSVKPSQESWIKIIELLAADEFIYKQGLAKNYNVLDHVERFSEKYEAPSKNIVGLYRPEEHIDNPKGLVDESILGSDKLSAPVRYKYTKIDETGKTTEFGRRLYGGEIPKSLDIAPSKFKMYIKHTINPNDKSSRPSSMRYINEQLRLAQKEGRTKAGLRHFGAALHVLEDFYAHSNFIEVLLIKLGYSKVNPWVDTYIDNTKISQNSIDACKIPIVTGNFGLYDLVASMTPKIANEYFSTSIEHYEKLDVGHRTFQELVILIMLDDYIEKEEGLDSSQKYSFEGFGYKVMKSAYLKYLGYQDALRLLEKVAGVGHFITVYKEMTGVIAQVRSFLPNLIANRILNSFDEIISNRQTNTGPLGTDPSHTQLAKDHTDHHFNDLAGTLSYYAVGRVGTMMDKCWKGDKEVPIEKIINLIYSRYFVHPCDPDCWADDIVEKWAKANEDKMKSGEQKTAPNHNH